MARLTATNFSGALQFPYATAGTDLFKKEDVQTLALAVDQHDHSSGKGPALAAGSITSGMITDGTITATDMAAGAAATNVGTLGGTLPNPSFGTAPNMATFAAGVTVTAGGVAVNAGGLTVTGLASLNSGATIATAGLTISGGGLTVTGLATFNSGATLPGPTGLTLSGGAGLTVAGLATLNGGLVAGGTPTSPSPTTIAHGGNLGQGNGTTATLGPIRGTGFGPASTAMQGWIQANSNGVNIYYPYWA